MNKPDLLISEETQQEVRRLIASVFQLWQDALKRLVKDLAAFNNSISEEDIKQ